LDIYYEATYDEIFINNFIIAIMHFSCIIFIFIYSILPNYINVFYDLYMTQGFLSKNVTQSVTK